jgi:hypothetical protein
MNKASFNPLNHSMFQREEEEEDKRRQLKFYLFVDIIKSRKREFSRLKVEEDARLTK